MCAGPLSVCVCVCVALRNICAAHKMKDKDVLFVFLHFAFEMWLLTVNSHLEGVIHDHLNKWEQRRLRWQRRQSRRRRFIAAIAFLNLKVEVGFDRQTVKLLWKQWNSFSIFFGLLIRSVCTKSASCCCCWRRKLDAAGVEMEDSWSGGRIFSIKNLHPYGHCSPAPC